MEYLLDIETLTVKQYNKLIELIKKIDSKFEGDTLAILNRNEMEHWKYNWFVISDNDESRISYKKYVSYKEIKDILKREAKISRFQ